MPSIPKRAAFFLKAAITGTLIWLVFRGVAVGEVAERLASISVGAVGTALALLALQGALAAQRWRAVMRLFGNVLSYPRAARLFFEGLFFNQTLPSTIGGDAVRMYRAIASGLPTGAAVNGVLLDRIAGFVGLLIVVAVTQPLLYLRVEEPAVRFVFAALVLAGIAVVVLLLVMGDLPRALDRWRVVRGAVALSRALRRVVSHRPVAVPVLGLSVVGHILIVAAVFVLARDLGLDIGFVDCLVLVPAVILLSAAPVSIAGWGVREGAMVAAFGLLGASREDALGLSVLFGLTMIAVGLPGGLLWLLDPGRRTVDPAVAAAGDEAVPPVP